MEKSVVKKILINVMLLLFVAVNGSAQFITGSITDRQGLPVEFANIVLLSVPDSSFLQGTVSDESGSFRIQTGDSISIRTYVIKISSIGYQTIYRDTRAGNMENIVLSDEAILLDEAVVIGKRPDFQIKDGTLTTRIENSLLSKSGTANDVLKYIPGIQGKEGEFQVFGKGIPVIYINGREVRDLSELDRLSSSEIRQIEVITNPGSRYGAEVKSVIRIKTIKREGEGMSFEARSTWGQSQNTDFTEQLNLNYRHNNLDVFAMFQYVHNNYLLINNVSQQVYVDTLWRQENRMEQHSLDNDYRGELGVNYQVNDNHSLGVRYIMSASPENKIRGQTESRIDANDDFYDYLLSESYSTTVKHPAHQINVYYSGAVGKLSLDFNADMLRSEARTGNEVIENSQEQESRIVTSTNNVDNKLYAAKLIASYPLAGGNLSLGSEFTSTRRTDLFTNPQEILPTTDSHIREDRAGAFAEYSKFIRIAYLNMGLRYEHVSTERSYDNFFPNVSLSTQIGKLQTQLGYTTKTKRPTYAQLSSNMNYINRFTYMNGNPALKPTNLHDITLSGSYDWFQFMLSYQREKDVILYMTDQYEKNPAITIITHRNYDRIDNVSVFLIASPIIKKWHPQLTIGLQKQWMDIEHNSRMLSMDRPLFIGRFNNGIQFPYGWTLHVDLFFQGKGDFQNIYINRNVFMMDASLTKSFFDDRLSFNLQGIDLTHGRKDGNVIYNKHMDLTVNNVTDSREVRLTVRYKFNTTKNKYKGKGAAEEEIRRL